MAQSNGLNPSFVGPVSASAFITANSTSGNGAAINATATATAAQIAGGYITSTSASPTTITLPTGTLLGAAVGAQRGTVIEFFVDNSAGASTVTIAYGTGGQDSALAAANAAVSGLKTVPSGASGFACFVIMFTSATTFVMTRAC